MRSFRARGAVLATAVLAAPTHLASVSLCFLTRVLHLSVPPAPKDAQLS